MLAISPYLHNFVTSHGCDPYNQCVWVTLLIQEISLGILLNVFTKH